MGGWTLVSALFTEERWSDVMDVCVWEGILDRRKREREKKRREGEEEKKRREEEGEEEERGREVASHRGANRERG